MAILGQMQGAMHVVVVIHSLSKLLAGITVISETKIMIVDRAEMGSTFLREQHVVKSDSIPWRLHMKLADGISLIAAIPKALRDRWKCGHPVDRNEDTVTMGTRRYSGH